VPEASVRSVRDGVGPPLRVAVAPTSGVFSAESMIWAITIPWLWPAVALAPGGAT
jgi:hypothetical protein